MQLSDPWFRDDPHTLTPSSVTPPPRRAASILCAGLLFGTLTQALFWRVSLGLNVLVWTVLVAAHSAFAIRPRRVTPTAAFAVAAAVCLALSFVRLASRWTATLALPSVVALLALLPVLLRDEVPIGDLARAPLDALRSLAETRRAAREVSSLPRVALGGRHGAAIRTLKGVAVGIPVTAVFVVLLSADSGFAAVVNAVEARLGEGVSFAAWSLLTTAGALFGTALFDRRPAEPARRAASPFRIPKRDHVAVSHGAGRPLIEPTTWLMVVGQVALVFAVFVVANLHALFGGHALVRAPGSLTYSNYLHTGFGQLLFAAALSLTLVVVGHAALRGRGAGDPAGPVPGGVKAKVAECTLIALTAVTVVSCAQRLAVYEDAYGASRLRLGVAFILLGVVIALGLTALTSVRRGWRGYGGALAASMVGLVVLASATNADQYVARTNLDRASRGLPLDVDYLASLSRDAAPALDHPYLASHPEAARALREAYCAPRASRDLRAWRGLGSCPAAEPYVPVLTVATHTPDTLAGARASAR